MRILGVDPGSGKGLSVFEPAADGGKTVDHVHARKVRKWWDDLNGPVLVGWDAPLWFYAGEEETFFTKRGKKGTNPGVATRPIEQFLQHGCQEERPPSAIKTGGFSGLSHWAVSQLTTGLPVPLLHSKDTVDSPRSKLLVRREDADVPSKIPMVVETHPAVTLWCALGPLPFADVETYKGKPTVCAELLSELKTKYPQVPDVELPKAADDALDAVASWLSAELFWTKEAMLLGSPVSGGSGCPRPTSPNGSSRRSKTLILTSMAEPGSGERLPSWRPRPRERAMRALIVSSTTIVSPAATSPGPPSESSSKR